MTATVLLWTALVGTPHAVSCQPDPAFTPTPTLRWDESSGTATLSGFHLWFRPQGQQGWMGPYDLPCSGVSDPPTWECPGTDLDVPVQRFAEYDNSYVDFTVTAYNSAGESAMSNVVTICMPPIWRGGPYL